MRSETTSDLSLVDTRDNGRLVVCQGAKQFVDTSALGASRDVPHMLLVWFQAAVSGVLLFAQQISADRDGGTAGGRGEIPSHCRRRAVGCALHGCVPTPANTCVTQLHQRLFRGPFVTYSSPGAGIRLA